jgi:predicted lipid-binding transport protein (Tim44 family)
MVGTTALIIAGAGLALSAGSTFYSIQQQRKAASAQRTQQNVAARRSRRQTIREALIRRAETTSVANAVGADTGSGFSGSLGSLGSQLGSGLGFQSQMTGLSGIISSASSNAQTGQALAGLGSSLFSFGMSQYGSGPKAEPTNPGSNAWNETNWGYM